mmetsp:Transcript_58663/g.136943  ORF Transcript_58663/g.136943 Transcript_58663/m.136943 type:complete len:186 (-) Transcript_58663:84-641(-)
MGSQCCCEEGIQGQSGMVDVSQVPIVNVGDERLDEPMHQKAGFNDVPVLDSEAQIQRKQDFGFGNQSPPPTAAAAPAAKQEPPPVQQESLKEPTFLVDVKAAGGKLGFGIGHRQGESSIEVVKIYETGIIPTWNKEHPDKLVTIGSRIVAVNGNPIVAKDREEMLRDIQDAVRMERLRLEVASEA